MYEIVFFNGREIQYRCSTDFEDLIDLVRCLQKVELPFNLYYNKKKLVPAI